MPLTLSTLLTNIKIAYSKSELTIFVKQNNLVVHDLGTLLFNTEMVVLQSLNRLSIISQETLNQMSPLGTSTTKR